MLEVVHNVGEWWCTIVVLMIVLDSDHDDAHDNRSCCNDNFVDDGNMTTIQMYCILFLRKDSLFTSCSIYSRQYLPLKCPSRC